MEAKEQLKSCETREVPYIFRYTSGYFIPNLVLDEMSSIYLHLPCFTLLLVSLLFCSLIPNRAKKIFPGER